MASTTAAPAAPAAKPVTSHRIWEAAQAIIAEELTGLGVTL